MTEITQFFRANPGAAIITALILMATFVLSIIAFMMSRSGVSMRPIAFLAGFFAIVIIPQALGHYGQAFGWIPKKDLTWVAGASSASNWTAREDLLTVKEGRFANPVAVYGADVDTTLIKDLREGLSNIFGKANAAEMAVTRTMSTVVLATFTDEALAEDALQQYAGAMIGGLPPRDADGTHTIIRQNDAVKLLRAGRTIVAYTAPNAAAVSSVLAESPIVMKAAAVDKKTEDEFWLYRVPVLIAIVVGLVAFATIYFFKGAMWASEAPAAAGVAPVPSATLRERLMAINELDVPFSISPSLEDSSLLVATYRYADAKWMDLARVHGMRRTYRIVMKLDEKAGTVRPTEQIATMDWSAGPAGANFQWMTARGITFFQYEHQRVFGLQLDSNFKFTPKLSYQYTFNLQEMKAPIIDAVTRSGWRWRPMFIEGPSWMHWLTH